MENCKSVAKTILNQLGGNRFLAMTGSHRLVAMPAEDGKGPGLRMKLRRNASKANYLTIRLNSLDTYDVRFFRADSRTGIKTVEEFKGLYNDQLQEIFTEVTGFYTSL